MIRSLISAGLHIAGNAIGLIVAAVLLDDMSIDGAAFIIAVLIFTVVELIAQPLLRRGAERSAPALQSLVALVATFVALLVTELISDGLTIDGASTWVLATLIVWLCATLAGFVLGLIFLRNRREERR